MTQQEVLNFNKRCTKFLGGFKKDKREKVNPLYIFPTFRFYRAEMQPDYMGGSYLEHDENCNYSYLYEMKFHSDWNWIHEIIDAIENIKIKGQHIYSIQPRGATCKIKCSTQYSLAFDVEMPCIYEIAKSKKEAAVQAIDKFLIWYEQNRKS